MDEKIDRLGMMLSKGSIRFAFLAYPLAARHGLVIRPAALPTVKVPHLWKRIVTLATYRDTFDGA